jgi:photosystem II stability/assembly factor-like uncharacterized protein
MKKITLTLALATLSLSVLAQSWNIQHSSAQSLYDIHFVNSQEGWVVGNNNVIFHTTNGGTTWEAQTASTLTAGSYIGAVFTPYGQNNTVYAAGAWNVFVKSTDGGANWANMTPADPINGLWFEDMDFATVDKGIAVGRGLGLIPSVIHKTDDGGASWQDLSQNIPNTVTGRINSVDIEGNSNYYFCGDNGVILHTTDGGTTITQIPSGTTENLNAIEIVMNEGWCVGDNGTILKSSDAGATWTALSNSYLGYPMYDVQLINSGEVFIGMGGGILHVTGGNTIVNEAPEFDNSGIGVRGLYMNNTTTGWCVGNTKIYGRTSTSSLLEMDSYLSIYPNPAEEIVTITVKNASSFTITNSIGQLLLNIEVENSAAIDLSSFQSGIYFITNVKTGETKQLVKR